MSILLVLLASAFLGAVAVVAIHDANQRAEHRARHAREHVLAQRNPDYVAPLCECQSGALARMKN